MSRAISDGSRAAAGGAAGGGGAADALALGALPEVRTFCESVLYECLAREKAEVLPGYLRLYHLHTALP